VVVENESKRPSVGVLIIRRGTDGMGRPKLNLCSSDPNTIKL